LRETIWPSFSPPCPMTRIQGATPARNQKEKNVVVNFFELKKKGIIQFQMAAGAHPRRPDKK
ncbi:MAG: hypothetical protein V1816_28045, partial [Pseudomonadota bacterium]